MVRHSNPEMERDQPASAWRLDEVGRRRSKLLTDRLRGFSPDVVWSSREPKAVETAEIVAAAFGVPVRTADGLEEHHRRGVPYFLTNDEFESAVEQLFCSPDQLVLGTDVNGGGILGHGAEQKCTSRSSVFSENVRLRRASSGALSGSEVGGV